MNSRYLGNDPIEEEAARLGTLIGVGSHPCTSVYNDAAVSLNDGAVTVLGMNSERHDGPVAQHFTSSANLTGTVEKTAASTALVGTGTAFTTELSVGQVIAVPGTAVEKRVVIAITDDTHLTVSTAFANSASGQTATRVNSVIVCRQAGKYAPEGTIPYAANATGYREARLVLNDATVIGRCKLPAVNTAAEGTIVNVGAYGGSWALSEWDFVELAGVQNSGGALDTVVSGTTAPALGWKRVG